MVIIITATGSAIPCLSWRGAGIRGNLVYSVTFIAYLLRPLRDHGVGLTTVAVEDFLLVLGMGLGDRSDLRHLSFYTLLIP